MQSPKAHMIDGKGTLFAATPSPEPAQRTRNLYNGHGQKIGVMVATRNTAGMNALHLTIESYTGAHIDEHAKRAIGAWRVQLDMEGWDLEDTTYGEVL